MEDLAGLKLFVIGDDINLQAYRERAFQSELGERVNFYRKDYKRSWKPTMQHLISSFFQVQAKAFPCPPLKELPQGFRSSGAE